MKWFANMRLGAKLITSFIIVAILAGLVGLIGVTNIQKVDRNYSDLYLNFGVAVGDIGQIGITFNEMRATIRDILIDQGSIDRMKYVNKLKDLDQRLNTLLPKAEKSMQTDKGKRIFNELKDALNQYNSVRDRVINLALTNHEDQAMALFRAQGIAPATAVNDRINSLFDAKASTGAQRSQEYNDLTKRTVVMVIVIIILAVTVAIGFGIFISRLISNQIQRLLVAAEGIAEGDLDVNIVVNSKDEIGSLATAFRTMAERMNNVMSSISTAAEQVATGSRQVSDSSMDLSQGATEQASSVEELTASLEQISAQTKQNADNANEANQLSTITKENALQGNTYMQDMLKAMEEINDSSANISRIIKVIDEIAFQTNILALNAAVEAARAGQHGKGFAVVAEEVRNLAERSANAAKETTSLIESSIIKVGGGTKIAYDTAKALGQIVEDIAKVAEIVSDIAIASNEQSLGISQINQGLLQVSDVVQTNSATSEESAAASEELSSQAESLRDLVSRFKLKKNGMHLDKFDGLSPEILKVLEKMNDQSKDNIESNRKSSKKVRIALSDNEFGKY